MPHIDLNRLDKRELFPGAEARFVHTEMLTISFLSAAAGAIIPEHAHPHEQVVIIEAGELELTVGDDTCRLVPGQVLTIPSNVPHSGRAIKDCEVMDVFAPVREDFK